MTRIYYPYPLSENEIIQLKDERITHYLKNVLRVKAASPLILFNGLGGEYTAQITHIHKKNISVQIQAFTQRDSESPLAIHLAQGIAKGEKMDFIVQKATELGVQKITPIITEYSNVRLSAERQDKRLLHWQAVAISACEQSGRTRIPQIMPVVSFDEFVGSSEQDATRFVLSPHTMQRLNPQHKLSAATLLIGPEGGFSQLEIDLATQQGFLPINFGPRILRTETATIAALSIVQFQYGDL